MTTPVRSPALVAIDEQIAHARLMIAATAASVKREEYALNMLLNIRDTVAEAEREAAKSGGGE